MAVVKAAKIQLDGARCTACHACTVACMDAHARRDFGPIFRIDSLETGEWINLNPIDSAPNKATEFDNQSLWQQDIRIHNVFKATENTPASMQIEEDVMTCIACAARLNADLDPICVAACPVRALTYTK